MWWCDEAMIPPRDDASNQFSLVFEILEQENQFMLENKGLNL